VITPDRLAFADSPTRGKSAHALPAVRNIDRSIEAGAYLSKKVTTWGGLREAQIEAGVSATGVVRATFRPGREPRSSPIKYMPTFG
jgi:ribosomal protein L35AE/L33A